MDTEPDAPRRDPGRMQVRQDDELSERVWIAGKPLEDRQDYASGLFPDDGPLLSEEDWRRMVRRVRSYDGDWRERRARFLEALMPDEVVPGVNKLPGAGLTFRPAGSLNNAEIEKIFDEEWPPTSDLRRCATSVQGTYGCAKHSVHSYVNQ